MIDLNEPLAPEQAEELCRRIARRVVRLGLATPAILFLDMHRPLSRLAGQALLVASPVLAPVFGLDGVGEFSRLMYQDGGAERLIGHIEAMHAARVKEAT
ncbi:MAG: hypothetical protein IT209_06305 [Armatimonadetes bacterium]|nr:hypothetical protein [Armatimonadota bacterium]